MLKSDWSFLKSLVVGFLLFNVLAVGALLIWSLPSTSSAVVGLFWFSAKAFTLRVLLRAGCAARCRGCASTS